MLWGTFEWQIRSLETSVWKQSDFSLLEKRENVLLWIAEYRIAPRTIIHRVNGLLGDLAHHRNKRATAAEFYSNCLPLSFINSVEDPGFPSDFRKAFGSVTADFSRGYADYQSSTPSQSNLNDEWFDTKGSELSFSREQNAWPTLEKIAQSPLPKHDVERLRGWMKQTTDENSINEFINVREQMLDLCEKHRGTIRSLSSLSTYSIVPDEQDRWLPVISACRDFADLLAIDAITQMQLGNAANSQHSLDATYHLLHHMQRAPGFTSVLVCNVLRQNLLKTLEGSIASPLQPLFRSEYLMGSSSFELALKGEYQNSKRTIEESLSGSSGNAQRVRQMTMQRHLENFSAIRDKPQDPPKIRIELILADWIFCYRKYFDPKNRTSYDDGQSVAAAFVDLSASIVAATAVPNLAKVDEGITRTIESEQRMLAERVASSLDSLHR